MEAGGHGRAAQQTRAGARLPTGGRVPLTGMRALQTATPCHGAPRCGPILQERGPRQRPG
eukprot:2816852-Alexandrium_andersonii.AAC.1